MRFLPLIWRNLARKKLRTFLTLLCILMAFVLFGYLSAIRVAFSAGIDVAGADRLVVRHKVSLIMLMPESYRDRIEQVEGVDSAVYATWFGGVYQDPKNFFGQFPVEPEAFLDMYPEYEVEPGVLEKWEKTKIGAVVGRTTMDRFGWKVGDRIPVMSPLWPKNDGTRNWEFEIVGVYDGEKGVDRSNMFFRYDYFDETRGTGDGLVGWYWVRVEDPDRAAEVAEAIDAEFANSAYETKSEPEGAFIQGFANQIGNIAFIIKAILAAVFFTILLVAGNTMAQSVRERVAEIGVLKALGFTHGRVLFLVLAESCLLAGVGGVLGLGTAWMLITFLGDPTNGSLPVFYFPVPSILLGVGLVLALGLVTGILPALQAQRLRIADALRR